MSRRQLYIAIVGLLLVLIGAAALWFPVYLAEYDLYGIKISCGNGFGIQQGQISHDANAPTAGCGPALLIRRAWAIPILAIGWSLIGWVVVLWMRADPTLSDEPEHLLPHPEIGWS